MSILENSKKFKDKTVLITGAAGFIGSHLCDRLLGLGAKVVGVDNFITGRKSNIAHLLENQSSVIPKFTFIEADVNQAPEQYLPVEFLPVVNQGKGKSPKKKFDYIFHFASPASPPRYQAYPVETYLVNSMATHQLLQFLLMTNSEAKFLFAGTSEAYGDPQEHPQKETYWGNVNPNGVRSCYDEAKRLGETICGVHERDFEMDVRIVRIFNTYGPQMDPDDGRVIPNFVKQALQKKPLTIYGDGSQTRSYCYVSDLVEGVLLLGSKDGLKGETVNLGNPGEFTVKKTAEIIQKLVNVNAEKKDFNFKMLPKDDPIRRKPDINKAKKLLGWEPKVSFEEGLKRTIRYFGDLVL